jgi:hypothetical protein
MVLPASDSLRANFAQARHHDHPSEFGLSQQKSLAPPGQIDFAVNWQRQASMPNT